MTVCMEAPTHGFLEQVNDDFDGDYMLNKEVLWEQGKNRANLEEDKGTRTPLGPAWETPQLYLFQVHSNTLKFIFPPSICKTTLMETASFPT